MQICKKCGEILQLDYEKCPFCGEQLKESNDSEASDALHEKIKQEQKKEHDEHEALLDDFHKRYKIALTVVLTFSFILMPISLILLFCGGIVAKIIGTILIVGGFCLFIYTGYIRRGFFCPLCDHILYRRYGSYCSSCGQKLR